MKLEKSLELHIKPQHNEQSARRLWCKLFQQFETNFWYKLHDQLSLQTRDRVVSLLRVQFATRLWEQRHEIAD